MDVGEDCLVRISARLCSELWIVNRLRTLPGSSLGQSLADQLCTDPRPPEALGVHRALIARFKGSTDAFFAIRTLSIRRIVRSDLTAHSQTLKTRHPFLRSARETRRSRFRLSEIFFLQKISRLFEGRLHRGQPCQKQPSTNRAILRPGQAKSGLPGTFQCFR
jgi:hypothetical protein